MAEAVVGPLIENLNSLIQRELGLVWGVKTEIKKLSRTLSTIRVVLADAEVQQNRSRAVRNWLMKLKDAAYDAQDILDDWAESIRNHYTNRVRDSFLSLFNLKRLMFRYKIAKQIKEIRERLDEIAKEKFDFHLKEGLVDMDHQCIISPCRETSSVSTEPRMYGRDEDKENIVKMLLENVNNEHVISVCPIIGIGGLGKTTLAQFVYNDDRVQKHFDAKIWICVSENFNVKRLLRKIIQVVSESRFDHDNLDVILDQVKEKLRGKKFLLVLDDVWSDDVDKWNLLKRPLTSGAAGSSIIVTARKETVASITTTFLEAYRLKGLLEDDCWSLFRWYAFNMGKKLEKPNLVSIGQEIVRKCAGLPLATKALGSLLRFKDEEKQWEQVRDNEIWDIEEDVGEGSGKILSALRLSYNYLSPRAKQCFAYCSLFPKDCEMRKKELVHLWLANGHLQIRKMEPENVGENVFGELKMHSFFQDIKEDKENITTFKIHDLLHDLASSVMKKEHSRIEVEVGMTLRNTIINNGTQDDEIRPRHVSIIILPSLQSSSSIDVSCIHPFLSFERRHLRTLLLFSYHNRALEISSHAISAISCLKHIRTLRIVSESCKLRELPPSFGNKLKHLRYLNLSHCGLSSLQGESFCGMKKLQILDLSGNYGIKILPHSMGKYLEHLRHLNLSKCDLSLLLAESLCGMKNLQVLDLSWNSHMKTLPDSIGNVEHLRHLNLSHNAHLELLPESLGGLTELKSLKLNDCVALKMLPQNTSRLCSLRQLENNGCWTLMGMPGGIGQGLCRLEKLSYWVAGSGGSGDIQELGGLHLLRGSLRVSIRTTGDSLSDGEELLTNKKNLSCLHIAFNDDESGSERVLGVLKPPSNIEILRIDEYGGSRFPNWMQMRDPRSCFPRLMSIELNYMRNVEEWSLNWKENECLPTLQQLDLWHCLRLKTLPEELGNLTFLKSLHMYHCDALVSIPSGLHKLTSLENLEVVSCQQLMLLPQLQLMTSLKNLTIEECPELKFVFDGLQRLTLLERLYITRCPGVVILKGELDQLVDLRGPSILCNVDKKLVQQDYSHSTTISEISCSL